MSWKAVLFDEKEVPRNVLVKIFLMLPWPDLLRCARVCKGWKLILSSKAFTALHLENQEEHLLVKAGDPLEGKTSTFTLICKQSLNKVEHYQLLPNPHMSHSMLVHNTILGCCNGILCLHCHRDFHQRIVLWNPVTNEFRVPTLPENLSTSTCVFGFGFDSQTKDYKVVAAKKIEVVPGYEFYVYNLSTGFWRMSLNGGGGCGGVIKSNMKIKERGGTCTGNAFSWWIMEGEKDHSRILSFAMASEKIILTSLPYGIWSGNNGELVRYDQSLAVIYNDCNVHSIWVLGELGVEGSWTCKFKIGRLLPEESTALWSFNTIAPVITAFITQHHDDPGSASVSDGGVFLGRERSTFIPSNQYLFQENNISEIVLIDVAKNKTRKRTSVYKFQGTKSVFQLCSIKKSLVPLINAAETQIYVGMVYDAVLDPMLSSRNRREGKGDLTCSTDFYSLECDLC